MLLSALVREIDDAELAGDDTPVRGITHDSRAVKPGDLFVAVPGLHQDARKFVDDAVSRGAAAVLASAPVAGIPTVIAPRIRQAMAEASWAIHEHPEHELTLIGITGTNGKTTVATVLTQVLNSVGRPCGVIGTLGVRYDDVVDDSPRTTPESTVIAEHLAAMVRRDVRYVAMEATSIGINLERTWKLPFAVTVFTNFTRDHLDYHLTEANYLAAKLRLFREQAATGTAVINRDDPVSDTFIQQAQARVLTYGLDAPADYAAVNLRLESGRTCFELIEHGRTWPLETPLIGRFNVSNVLAVVATARTLGVDMTELRATLQRVRPARGRAEAVLSSAPFTVVIDYAHTPDALEKILQTLRELQPRRLTTVFGAGGDRDRGKRPLMAQVAARWSDMVWITSDNPRTEAPDSIIDEIAGGMPANQPYERNADRRAAIQHALQQAQPGDAIVIAGKGHETYQEMAGIKHPFDDREEVLNWLRQSGYAV